MRARTCIEEVDIHISIIRKKIVTCGMELDNEYGMDVKGTQT